MLVQHFDIQEQLEQQHRASIMLSKLSHKSREERRIASELMAIRHEKDVIVQHRCGPAASTPRLISHSLFREQQIEAQRRKDFEFALDREAKLLQAARCVMARAADAMLNTAAATSTRRQWRLSSTACRRRATPATRKCASSSWFCARNEPAVHSRTRACAGRLRWTWSMLHSSWSV